jgi:hypothetical protein
LPRLDLAGFECPTTTGRPSAEENPEQFSYGSDSGDRNVVVRITRRSRALDETRRNGFFSEVCQLGGLYEVGPTAADILRGHPGKLKGQADLALFPA